MKALSIKQPYANWIAEGSKRYEIRSWQTEYRGPLLVVSCKKPAAHLKEVSKPPYGAIVAKVELLDIVPFTRKLAKKAKCKYIKGQFAWDLKVIDIAKNFYPVKGKLSLYDIEENPKNGFAIKTAFVFQRGQSVIANGYEGRIVRRYSEGLYEVKLPGGIVCICQSEITPIFDY